MHDTHADLFPAYSACTSIGEFTAASAKYPAAINTEESEDADTVISYAQVVCATNAELANTPICIAVASEGTDETTAAAAPTTEQRTQVTSSVSDRDAVSAVLSAMFDAYNSGDYQQAATYVSDEVLNACGGLTGYAAALSQNRSIAGITYEVIAVEPGFSQEGGLSYFDVREEQTDFSGSLSPGGILLGLPFVKDDTGEWKIADQQPLGVGAFC